MTDMATDQHDRMVELRVAPRVENVAVVRTLVGAVGALEDFDVDSVADLHLAVDEACTQLIGVANPDATLVVVVEPGAKALRVEVRVVPCRPDSDVVAPGSFSWFVLSSLVDEVQTFRDGSQVDGGAEDAEVFGIVLTRRRAGFG